MIRWQSEVLGAWLVAAVIILVATATVGGDERRIPAIDIGTPHANVVILERAMMLGHPEPEETKPARLRLDGPFACELAAAGDGPTNC